MNTTIPQWLQGRRILVTGGARGLGAEFARSLGAQGARVVIADLRRQELRQTAQALGAEGLDVQALDLDLADPASIDECARRSVELLGGLDGLVNNAAITDSGGRSADELDVQTWDRVFQVNVRGTWLMTRACRAALARSGRGAVVNIASDTALWGAPRLLAYVSSKGAVIAMTRSLAREYGEDGISINSVAPGLTEVEATQYVPQSRHVHYHDNRAFRRGQLPGDVSGAVAFCLSDLARFITGQLIVVNGGFLMY